MRKTVYKPYVGKYNISTNIRLPAEVKRSSRFAKERIMAKYKKCPRCEINYILEEEDYCEICKMELKGDKHDYDFDEIDEDDVDLCPVCHKNYLSDGETICKECAAKEEYATSGSLDKDIDEEVDEIENDIDSPADDEEWEISLEEMQDEEFSDSFDEEEEEEEEEEKSDEEFEELGDLDDIEDLPEEEEEDL